MVEDLGGGSVRVTVQTQASGLEQGATITFILYQTRQSSGVVTRAAGDSTSSIALEMAVEGYMNGDDAILEVEDLVVGDTYTFTLQAKNRFGVSENTTSDPVTITCMSGHWV